MPQLVFFPLQFCKVVIGQLAVIEQLNPLITKLIIIIMVTATSLQNWGVFKMVKLLILLWAMFWILMNTESSFSKECYCLFSDIVSSGYD